MKQKKTVGVPAVESEQSAEVVSVQKISSWDVIWICLFSVLLFVSMTIQTGQMSLILAVLALVLSVGKGPLRRLRERLCIPVLGLLVFALMNGLAAIYSSFGSYALREYYKIFAAFALMVILLVRFDKRHIRGLLWGIAAVCAAISLLCIDSASSTVLFNSFNTLVEALDATFSTIEQAAETRVVGLYNDANVSGSILALGALLSLHLAHTEKKAGLRLLACFLLGLSAQGFFLSMSRGAILCFALSLLVWLVAEPREGRISLLFLMLFSALATLGAAFFAMPVIGSGSPLPDVLALVSGVGIFLLDRLAGDVLSKVLHGHGWVLLGLAGVLLAGCVAFVGMALKMTEAHDFGKNPMLDRAVSLPKGEYTISAEMESMDRLDLIVSSRTQEQALMGQNTVLYSGPFQGAVFTVEDDGAQVFFRFYAPEGGTLQNVTVSDGTEIPMDYSLVPEAVMSRLQGGLFSGSSYLLRVQYMKDAWKIFKMSPVIGHGLGCTEGLYTAVQPFYYQSLYAHNHILQVMDETGLVGLAAFLMMLLGALWLLLRNLRTETGSLAAVLVACWVMMNSHSLMEINFSIRAYQCLAFTVLLLPVILYAKPVAERVVKWAGWAAAGFIWLYLLVFGSLLESCRMVAREAAEFSTSNVTEFMETLKDYIRRDVFDHEQDQLTFVGNAVILNDSRYNGYMRKYAEELRASGTYTACSGLVRYYYLPRGEFEELFACSREGIAQEASTKEAWNLQLDFYRNEVLPAAGMENMDVFVNGVLALRDYLAEYSQGRLEEIELAEENQAFLNAVSSAQEAGVPADGMYVYLTGILGYGQGNETAPVE